MNTTVLNDPIADMLTRIRNAIAVRKHNVVVPHSNVKESVAKLLVRQKFLSHVEVEKSSGRKVLAITIHHPDENPKITEIARLSRPGRRQYVSADAIPVIKRGRGLVIMSTSKGMMTGDDAKKLGVGGEVICRVY
jgi:small subunit ribosomal protein S8